MSCIEHIHDLEGHKIPAIENLGVAGVCHIPIPCYASRIEGRRVVNASLQPQDAIDFTDNDIQQLGNFPLSERLKTLLLARNRISTIQPTIANSLPNLTVLVLTSNNLTELADLEPLSKLKRLTHLTLLENPVTRKDVSFILSHCALDNS
jgi:U2 small nuclear ribonucleoprotein A'